MFSKSLLVSTTVLVAACLVTAVTNSIYIISNAEVPSLGRPGLSIIGQQRATQCLPDLFASLDIGKIISCPLNEDSAVCFETIATAQPIADRLGLPIDTKCGADENTDDDCVTDLIKKFAKNSTQSILIVWDFNEVGALLEEDLDLNTDGADNIDGVHFDIFTVVKKNKITQVTSQNCTGIDDPAPGTFNTTAPSDSCCDSDKKLNRRSRYRSSSLESARTPVARRAIGSAKFGGK